MTRIARSPSRQGCQGGPQGAGKETAIAGGELGPKVHDLDTGRRAAGALRQHRVAIATLSGAPDALHRRGRAAENDRRSGKAGQGEGGIAGLQPRRAVALVRGIVLLVDDDEADVGEGRGQG